MKETVAVALSGGVDSAVSALLLREAGHQVEGLHMTNWDDDEGGYCTAAEDYQDALAVAHELSIPLHRVSFAAEYRTRVFQHFLAEYAAGRTPNPDVLCNREVKFGVCLAYARRLGATRLATGHYARCEVRNEGLVLLRGTDRQKDQSYFLHQVPAPALAAALFPVGALSKPEVRALARRAGLPVHGKRDSTGICFIGERPFREFLQRFLPAQPGPIESADGERLGEHAGLMYYTLGQRQGIGLGGRTDRPDAPWYVAAKDLVRNTLIVVQGHDHPALASHTVATGPPHWIGRAASLPLECCVKLRYRQDDLPALVREGAGGGLEIALSQPVRAVAPGQYAVLYDGERCLGGAVILASAPAQPALEQVAAARNVPAMTGAPPL